EFSKHSDAAQFGVANHRLILRWAGTSSNEVTTRSPVFVPRKRDLLDSIESNHPFANKSSEPFRTHAANRVDVAVAMQFAYRGPLLIGGNPEGQPDRHDDQHGSQQEKRHRLWQSQLHRTTLSPGSARSNSATPPAVTRVP